MKGFLVVALTGFLDFVKKVEQTARIQSFDTQLIF
jgi:hypothetical protein